MILKVEADSEEGMINFMEFLEVMESKINNDKLQSEELVDAFRVFDRDQSGFVSADELKLLL